MDKWSLGGGGGGEVGGQTRTKVRAAVIDREKWILSVEALCATRHEG